MIYYRKTLFGSGPKLTAVHSNPTPYTGLIMSLILKIINHLKNVLFNATYLMKTDAPKYILLRYLIDDIFKRTSIARLRTNQISFKKFISKLKFSNDWFTSQIPYWDLMFEKLGFQNKSSISALEIGSWEGLSSLFFLQTLKKSKLICVDTWEGADEHRSLEKTTKEILSNIEINFDKNLTSVADRLTKFKGTSFSYFYQNNSKECFDFIYIDGSHYCDDVIIDAIKCFEMLKVGGVMIFDDYLWQYYPNYRHNPASAINAFLKMKKGSYKVIHVYWQIIIQRIN